MDNGTDHWIDKTALVLPAHTRRGGEVTLTLLAAQMRVVALAPRLETIETLRAQLPTKYGEKLHTHDCDLNSPLAIKTEVVRLKRTYGTVDLLIQLPPDEMAAKQQKTFLQAARTLALLSDNCRVLMWQHKAEIEQLMEQRNINKQTTTN